MADGQTTVRRRPTRAQESPGGGAAEIVRRAGGRSRRPRLSRKCSSRIRLLIVHPSLAPESITKALGMKPSRAWKCGDPRTTPDGNSIPGKWPDSRWNHSFNDLDGLQIHESVEGALRQIATNERFWSELNGTGGTGELILSLTGEAYQGDSVRPDLLRRLAALGIGLGIEIYAVPQN